LTFRRAAEWSSARTLFEAQIAAAPLVGGGYQVLAAHLLEGRRGDVVGADDALRAEGLLERAVMLAPERVQAALAYARLELRRAASASDPSERTRRLADAEFFRLALRQDAALRTASGGSALPPMRCRDWMPRPSRHGSGNSRRALRNSDRL
jgi:hypothetical protein